MSIHLGDWVEEIVSGCCGVAVTRLEYITGEIEFGIQLPNRQTDEYPTNLYYANEKRLKVIKDKVHLHVPGLKIV